MGSVFTSPVPPPALRACWTVTGNANNALTAPSNLSPADTNAARQAADGRGPVDCLLQRTPRHPPTHFPHWKKKKTLALRSGEIGGFICVCLHMQVLSLVRLSALSLHVFHPWRPRAARRRGLHARLATGAPDLRGPFYRPAA